MILINSKAKDLWLVTDKQSKTVVLSWSCIFFHKKKIKLVLHFYDVCTCLDKKLDGSIYLFISCRVNIFLKYKYNTKHKLFILCLNSMPLRKGESLVNEQSYDRGYKASFSSMLYSVYPFLGGFFAWHQICKNEENV